MAKKESQAKGVAASLGAAATRSKFFIAEIFMAAESCAELSFRGRSQVA
jgi:hypothetical protein